MALLPLALMAAACHAADGPKEPGAGLEIASQVDAMFPGQTEPLVVAIDSVIVSQHTIAWRALDPVVATVDDSGVVTAQALGAARIEASSARGSDTIAFRVIAPPAGRIVFVGALVPADGFRVYEIQANGSGLHRFSPIITAEVGFPTFSPDGRVLAVDVGSPPTIWLMASDGDNVITKITRQLGCGASANAWSPDGTMLAVSSCASGLFEVWVSVLADSTWRQVNSFKDPVAQRMAFTPDGTALIVEAFQYDSAVGDRQSDLYRVELASGVTTRLTTDPEEDLAPFVDAPRGALYFSRDLLNVPGSVRTAEASVVLRADLDGGHAEPVTPVGPRNMSGFALAAHDAVTSPDGRWLAFSLNRGANPAPGLRLGTNSISDFPQLHVMRIADHAIVRLTHFFIADRPTWTSP